MYPMQLNGKRDKSKGYVFSLKKLFLFWLTCAAYCEYPRCKPMVSTAGENSYYLEVICVCVVIAKLVVLLKN